MKLIRRIGECVRVRILARLRTRYTRALEDEVARLRAENRALVNSILGNGGMPPVPDVGSWRLETGKPNADGIPVGSAQEPGGPERRPYRNGHDALSDAELPLRGVRRRSWQQIERALEVGDARAARLERESDTDAFPAPRNVVPRA